MSKCGQKGLYFLALSFVLTWYTGVCGYTGSVGTRVCGYTRVCEYTVGARVFVSYNAVIDTIKGESKQGYLVIVSQSCDSG